MPRLTRSVPKYRKHRASGQAVVTLNGTDHYLGPHGTKASRIEYDRLIAEWLAGGRSLAAFDPAAGPTVVEVTVAYMHHAERYYGKATRGEYANMKRVAAAINKLYANTPAAEFGPAGLKALRQSWIDGGSSRNHANATTKRVVRIFRWAAGEGMIPPAVPQALAMVPALRKGKTEARETGGVKPVDDETIDATLPHLPAVVAAMVQFQRYTGCRPGEVCALKAGDVNRDGEVWEATLAEHKTAHHDRSRTIYIGKRAQQVILPYLLRADDAFCFSPEEAVEERRRKRHAERKTPLSCGNKPGSNRRRMATKKPGRSYTTSSYAYCIRRTCEKHGIPHWSPGQLRHTSATAIRREYGVEAAQVLLGHSQVGTTQIYAEADRRKAIEVMRAIG